MSKSFFAGLLPTPEPVWATALKPCAKLRHLSLVFEDLCCGFNVFGRENKEGFLFPRDRRPIDIIDVDPLFSKFPGLGSYLIQVNYS